MLSRKLPENSLLTTEAPRRTLFPNRRCGEEFQDIMSVIKEKRSALTAEQEKQKEDNLQVKLSIIEELKELVESPDDANKSLHGIQETTTAME